MIKEKGLFPVKIAVSNVDVGNADNDWHVDGKLKTNLWVYIGVAYFIGVVTGIIIVYFGIL